MSVLVWAPVGLLVLGLVLELLLLAPVFSHPAIFSAKMAVTDMSMTCALALDHLLQWLMKLDE